MANPSGVGETPFDSLRPGVEERRATAADESFDPERVAAQWLDQQIAAGRLSPAPSPDVIAEVVRIVGPALRRLATKGREPAA
jgi:hypothetical protein